MALFWNDGTSLYHYGIPGMKWGVRRWQNPDGTYTEEGKKRYFGSGNAYFKKYEKMAPLIDKIYKHEDDAGYKNFINHEIDRSKEFLNNNPDKEKFIRSKIREDIDREKARGDYYTAKRLNNKNDEMYKTQYGSYKKLYEYHEKNSKLEKTEIIRLGQAVIKQFSLDEQPYIDKLKSIKYGSSKWFDEREKYFNFRDSYQKEYTKAVLKDLGEKPLSDSYIKVLADNIPSIGDSTSYYGSDYQWIYDPISGNRDYGLEEPYERWIKNKK